MLTHQGDFEVPLRPSCCKGEPYICWQPDVIFWVVDKEGLTVQNEPTSSMNFSP